MVKRIITTLAVLLTVILVGCDSGTDKSVETSRSEAGTIKSAITVPVRYNTQIWRDVTTDKMTVTISPREPVLIGAKAFIVHTSNGKTWFTWEGAQYLYVVNPQMY